ncbi:MAG: hypothetical protein VXX52_01035 [Candidatus Neomarinimicrobiota bacterium]|jgi:Flp pilus assembly secretin CpaC|nr:hypothetical protein [Candidatus Neomarinimicrobiota bacterium]MEC8703493.1 hypothetical protein [Candidatus Neomarinimicrobiota bacterium]MEC8705698.1 hypothetical protein [Candidatus Neomarinimicrobiota bacterium]|tara:strand:- start:1664 stop:3748 length:2085 start_codon:yes stop_codon:yes gene_type:complete
MKKIILLIALLSINFAQQRRSSSNFNPTSSDNAKSLRDLDYEVVKLSYIQTDRALAILKTMGYTVVEYRAGKGEISGENNFTPVFSNKVDNLNAPGVLPVIIKIPDTQTISLVEKSTSKASSKKSALGVDLGGVTLNNTTSGEPMQRLLVGYKSSDMRPLAQLLDLIANKIDVPASQVAIEALVIELNRDDLNELGVDFSGAGSGFTANFPPPQSGSISPFTVVLDRTLLGSGANFRANIDALVSKKLATIKSKPSALVLDGRQTRIQVGQQIPIVKTITDQIAKTRSVDYVPVGIVLNVRPRISEDGSSVTIQVETIISETEERIGATGGGDVESAPIINNRKVQSFVRVANNTPFIIGGLINEKSTDNEGGVPLLGTLPFIKNFFSVSGTKKVRREVIVVITPHIIKEAEDQFSRVIPQDSPLFDQDNNKSFPNSYRVRQGDIFDLSFIDESPVYQDIIKEVYKRADQDKTLAQKDPYKSILEGKIPGESVLVKKMLLDIISKMNYVDYVDPERIIYFASSDKDPAGFEVELLSGAIKKIQTNQAMKLTYSVIGKATLNKPFVQPTATVDYIALKDSYKNELVKYNKIGNTPSEDQFTILMSPKIPKYERRLYEVLILKKLLKMNPDLDLTLKYFKPGIEILFPSRDVLETTNFVVDRDAARLFYEVNLYYAAFGQEFNRGTAEIGRLIKAQ